MLRLERGDLGGGEFDAGEDEDRSEESTGNGAERIEGLREVEAALRGARVAHLRDEGVGGGFKEREAAGDDEQRNEEIRVAVGERGRPEEEGAGSEEAEADEDSGLVAEAAHDERGRQREQKIAHVKGELDETGLEAADGEGLHELADEDVVEVVGNGPKEEEPGDDDEERESARGDDARRIISGMVKGWRGIAGGHKAQSAILERSR